MLYARRNIMRLLAISCTKSQRGISLLESLVSLVVLALGVLGMLGVQLKNVADNQQATQRVIAARMADDLFERIKANTAGESLSCGASVGIQIYEPTPNNSTDWPTVAAPPASERCEVNACTPCQQATYDLWRWQQTVQATLPGGNATTFISPTDPAQLGVMIAWRLRQTDNPGGAAGATRAAWLNVDVPGGPACPADSACLVAYGKP